MTHRSHITLLLAAVWLCALAACGRPVAGTDSPGKPVAMKYATHLTMSEHDGYTKATFRNPWDTTRTLATYLLVPREAPMPEGLPEGTVVRVPLQRSVVYTAAHAGLIAELGALPAIAGVTDPQYMHNADVGRGVENGSISDCGSAMAPNVEKMIMLRPDAILLSAFENSSDHNKVAHTGVPIIDCPDYMETSPLARAEWMRFFGRLYGKGAEADSLFHATERRYLDLKAQMNDAPGKPLVLTDMVYGQSWGVPGALSITGVMIEDAGGRNPFDAYRQTGSVQMAPEKVLYTAKDADIWLIKYARPADITLAALSGENSVYPRFKAFDNGNVYGCNTSLSPYFDDLAFHPDRILANLAWLFHPDMAPKPQHLYFSRLSP